MNTHVSIGDGEAHRGKTLHLVRHAQGIHNVASEIDHDLLSSYDYFDAHLSPLGWKQVDDLRKNVEASGLSKKIDLVITSSLLRTMQTAVGVFGGKSNTAPFMAVELCRERLGVHPCDKRRHVSEYKSMYPHIDFSQVESDEDILWKPKIREKNDELAARGLKFFEWLWTRKEKEIAIVTHSGFLSKALKALFTSDTDPSLKNEISKYFSNCEIRSLNVVDGKIYKIAF